MAADKERRKNIDASMIPTPKFGEILMKEFMEPLGISKEQLAQSIDVSPSWIQEILDDQRKMTADLSMRLGRYFGVSEEYFFDIQRDIDIRNEKN